MNISSLTASQLKQAISLLDRKESLQKQIEELEQKIGGLLGGTPPASKAGRGRPGRPAGAKSTRKKREPGARRGDLKAKVMSELKSAGDSGLSIKELSEKLKTKGSNLYAWFGSTGKKVTTIQKIGPAKYKLVE